MDPVLRLQGIVKEFPGVRALDAVDFDVRAGEVHALLGENGAGKSTLIKVATGLYAPEAGHMTLGGAPYHPRTPRQAIDLGVSTVHQEVNLVPNLSVAENVCLGRESRSWSGIRWREVHARARRALSRLGLDLDTRAALGSLPIAVQQLVAIARSLDVDSKVLVLDEPTSSLDRRETAQLFDVVRALRSKGLGIVFVTHFLDQVYQVSDRITVLRNGRLAGTFEAGLLPKLALVTHMIGRPAEAVLAKAERFAPVAGEEVLRAVGLGRKGGVEGVDVSVRKGETVGLAGLLGSGRTEALRLMFGADRPTAGRLSYGGRQRRRWNTRAAVKSGVGLCPEDRQSEGVFPNLSVRENLLATVQSRAGLGRVSRREAARLVAEAVDRLKIKAADLEAPVQTLSGGNQQKVVLGRWLASRPQLLLLDEPTRGIDVGARFEVMALVAAMARQGLALVFVSSELDETVQASDRVYVLRDRRLVSELGSAEVSEDSVMAAIAGEGP